MEGITAVLILGIIFGAIYGIVQLNFQHKERKMLLDKGADPSKFQFPKEKKATSLRYGLLLIGIALGIFLGNVLTVTTDLMQEAAYFSMVFLFGGLALVISFFVEKRM
jgi:hypothetical protein